MAVESVPELLADAPRVDNGVFGAGDSPAVIGVGEIETVVGDEVGVECGVVVGPITSDEPSEEVVKTTSTK